MPTLRHDEYFRFMFQDPDAMRDLLERAIPPPLLEPLDTSRLTIEPDTYISPKLRRGYTDVLV